PFKAASPPHRLFHMLLTSPLHTLVVVSDRLITGRGGSKSPTLAREKEDEVVDDDNSDEEEDVDDDSDEDEACCSFNLKSETYGKGEIDFSHKILFQKKITIPHQPSTVLPL
ncbi:hypothetical protein MKW94_025725, partial [Papaver nudicaule]|nr:hypothetical protein [Papaver nudicaule]